MQKLVDTLRVRAYPLQLEGWTCGYRLSESSRVPTAHNDDVSDQYLELVREHQDPEVLAVYFPEALPRMALIERPGDRYKHVRRHEVTALLELRRREPEQLELRWPSPPPSPPPPPQPSVELPAPTLARARPSAPLVAPLWMAS